MKDIVHEAIKRKARTGQLSDLTMGQFNGTTKSPEHRAEILRDFNDPHRDPKLLLCSAGAGGTGLNITAANHLILCEPLWSPGQEEQIKGRVHRMPQLKTVTVYHLVAEYSAVDKMMQTAMEAKYEVQQDLMFPLVRQDREPVTDVSLPTRSELSK